MLPEQWVGLRIVREALTEQAGDRDSLGRERLLHGLEDLAELGLARAEREGARLLVKVDERRRAVDSRVQQQLHHPEGDVDDGGVGAVQQRAAQPERRVGPPRAAQAAALPVDGGGALLRLATLDLGVDGMHDGLARARRLLGGGRGRVGGGDRREHL